MSREPTKSDDDNRVSDFFDIALDMACIAGFDGYFKRVNQAWLDTMGWSREELFARPIFEFVHPADRQGVMEARSSLKSANPLESLTNRYQCKDGSYRWLEWRAVAHPEERRVYAVARDITELQRSRRELDRSQQREQTMQRQLTFADRMASVGTLAAGVAHEINNPLAYLTGNLSLLTEHLDAVRGDPSDEKWDTIFEMLDDAQHGAERIRKIVKGLQTFSQVEEQKLTTFDIRPIVDEAIDMVAHEIRHRATLVRDHGPPVHVHADKTRLRQVVVDLLLNAAQAISEGTVDENEIRVSTSTDEDGRAVIEVRDTGEGIAESDMVRIFDPFYTTRPIGVGTGLGLSVCHNLIDGFGGELTVESTEGEGSTFRAILPPATADGLATDTELHGDPSFEVVGGSVLVVDDEPAVARLIQRTLSQHEVTCIDDAREALEVLERGQDFHIIFLDVMMPEMSGMEFHNHLQRRFPASAERVVFISGGAFTEDARSFLRETPNQILDKPMSHDEIRSLASRYVRLFG